MKAASPTREGHLAFDVPNRHGVADAQRRAGRRFAMAVEQPPFRLIAQDGAFEVRDYGPRLVAEVQATGGQAHAAGQGFRLLAAYIFGANEARRSIAMTAPVSQVRNPAGWVVRFTLPQDLAAAQAPRPTDRRVVVSEISEGRFAVVRFSGVATEAGTAQRIAQLHAWTGKRGLRATGPPALAQYDPPWTLWFLRHNEIIQPIAR